MRRCIYCKEYLEYKPTASICEIEDQCNINKESARIIIIHKHEYRSYKYNLHQHLHEGDHDRRMEYGQWFLRQNAEDNNFVLIIMLSDETKFTNSMFNKNYCRYWVT